MEVILYNITVTLLAVTIVTSLVFPALLYLRRRRIERMVKLAAVKRLFGLHFQGKAFLISGKR